MPQPEECRKHAWDYFALHAQQRLTTFNFFLVFSTLLAGGMITTFQKEYRVPWLGAVAGGLLAVLAFVFWKLDGRNRQLIKNAEDGLRALEETWFGPPPEEPPRYAVFSRDAAYVARARNRAGKVSPSHWSYSDCFNIVYISMALVGLTGAAVAFITHRAG